MEVKELQQKILELEAKWNKKRDYTPTEQTLFNHLVEEVGELAQQYVNQDQRQDKYSKEELENALGDIMIIVVELAVLRGLDVEEVLTKIIVRETKELEE